MPKEKIMAPSKAKKIIETVLQRAMVDGKAVSGDYEAQFEGDGIASITLYYKSHIVCKLVKGYFPWRLHQICGKGKDVEMSINIMLLYYKIPVHVNYNFGELWKEDLAA